MQTQDLDFKQIQNSNEEARKKLETFRSGLEKLMNKKNNKKTSDKQIPKPGFTESSNSANNYYSRRPQTYQIPSNDHTSKSPQNISNSNMNFLLKNNMMNSTNKKQVQGPTMGFNSTLFKQIGQNESNLMSNSSTQGINYLLNNNNRQANFYDPYSTNNYNSTNSNNNYTANYNSVNSNYTTTNKQYFSTSSKGSGQGYQQRNDFKMMPEIKQNQDSFKNSFKILNQADEFIAKINKTSKLPVKSIQKYIHKNSSKDNVESSKIYENLQLDISKSDVLMKQFYQKRSEKKQNQKGRYFQNEQKERNKSQNTKNQNFKEQIKTTNQFLKNYKQKTNKLINTQTNFKMPPLPPMSSQNAWLSQKKLKAEQYKQKFDQIQQSDNNQPKQNTKFTPKKSLFQQKQKISKQMQKSPTKASKQTKVQAPASVQIHKNKIKETLSQRKKILKQQGMLDESIDLQFSDQQSSIQKQNQQSQNEIKRQNSRQKKHQKNKILQQQMEEDKETQQQMQNEKLIQQKQRQIQILKNKKNKILEELELLDKQLLRYQK